MSATSKAVLLVACVVQLTVPAWMIGLRERTLREGTVYDFPTQPIDPADPFRGRYVWINIQGQVPTNHVQGDIGRNRALFATVAVGEDGRALFTSVSRDRPEGDALRVHVWRSDSNLTVRADLDRLYMNEEEAPRAESVYRESLSQAQTSTVARVRIRGRTAVIEDVLINGVSLQELARKDSSP